MLIFNKANLKLLFLKKGIIKFQGISRELKKKKHINRSCSMVSTSKTSSAQEEHRSEETTFEKGLRNTP